MNPIEVTRSLRNSIVNYLLTTFDVNRDGTQAKLHDDLRLAFKSHDSLVKGPFLELTPPYVKGCSLRALVEDGVVEPQLLDLDCFRRGRPIPPDVPLYAHQEAAIRKLSAEHRSIVVSSGTGSGKTETFLIPILNDLLIDSTRGVRALLIYPLNALVNDQLDRLRDLLRGTEITFGRYTSELENKTSDAVKRLRGIDIPENEVISREQIRRENKIPQILITNYAMLEYLLLRPEDSVLFNSGAWRFIVLDEAHTYTGAKGIEVSMLLRRLKLRLGKHPGDIRCVATSATLVNDDASQAISFASNLFGEVFEASDIVSGQTDMSDSWETDEPEICPDPESYLDARIGELINNLQLDPELPPELILKSLANVNDSGGTSILGETNRTPDGISTAKAFLYDLIRRNKHARRLRSLLLSNKDEPISVDQAAEEVFASSTLWRSSDRINALYRIIELGLQAQSGADKPALLPVRFHVFARPPQGVWVCLNKNCHGREPGQDTPWSRIFTSNRDTCDRCGAAVYPISVCRTCGQVYVSGYRDADGRLQSESSEQSEDEHWYLTWSEISQDESLADGEDDEETSTNQGAKPEAAEMTQSRVELCLECRRTSRCQCAKPKFVTLYRVDHTTATKNGTGTTPVPELTCCARCKDNSRIKGSEIATPVKVTGSGPVSVLTRELYRNLSPSRNESILKKPGGGRKLLTFYDSRQGAARFAAYLQDVVNQDLYRFMVPQAVRTETEARGHYPDFRNVSLRCVNIGWEELRVFQNDVTLRDDIQDSFRLTSNQRDRLLKGVQARLLAEITTNLRSRQSLESLGLITVTYFEDDPDVAGLAEKTGLTAEQVVLLVRYLLDSLRNEKAVELPPDVLADDEVFGRHSANPSVVNGKASSREVPWVGTARHRRFRLIEKALTSARRPATEAAVYKTADQLWDWSREQRILIGSPSGGYRLSLSHIFFNSPRDGWYRCNQCQRLGYQAAALPCPHPTCQGTMSVVESLEAAVGNNYYYQVLGKDMIPLRVEEHTAQLDSEKGRSYQDLFKQGDINVLSCSTTFEMGIDLGDLQSVFMNNVPPTVANYRQRSGRAGRRSGSTAFILTWATDRPHDQLYFENPLPIIRGHVRVPVIHLENVEIRRRHANAILLSDFLRYRARGGGSGDFDSVGAFFDAQTTGDPHVHHLEAWLNARKGPIGAQLERFARALGIDTIQHDVVREFTNAITTEHQHYDEVTAYYHDIEDKLANERKYDDAKAYKKLLDRIRKDRLIDYLSNRGVLPSYSFPLATVEMRLPLKFTDAHLRLQRDLQYAISEFAPGSEIVADKRIWKSGGLEFFRDSPQRHDYKLCSTCNHLEMASDPGVPVMKTECPKCKEPYGMSASGRYVKPDGFRATSDSGKPAGQYVNRPFNTMRSALLLKTEPNLEELGNLIQYGYSRDGELFFVNEGESGRGFRVCMQCGTHVTKKDAKRCTGYYRGVKCESQQLETIRLGHIVPTDTLHLRLRSSANVNVSPHDRVFWNSLLYALLHGASRALQIERQDISGLLYPVSNDSGGWESSIVLYDTVPGGAGHVRDIKDHFTEVVREAYEIVSSCQCDESTSCVRCLRDYNNQYVYGDLRRGYIVSYLEALLADLENSSDVQAGWVRVSAVNRPSWLSQRITHAEHEVWIAATSFGSKTSEGLRESWVDTFRELVKRDVCVNLLLCEIPKPTAESREDLSLARHLQSLLDERPGKFTVVQINRLPDTQILIDPGHHRERAVRLDEVDFDLTMARRGYSLASSTSPHIVQDVLGVMSRLKEKGRIINPSELNAPASTTVYNVRRTTGKRESDIAPITEFFAQPVTTMTIHDPYLIDRERLFSRVSAYIDLAKAGGALEHVVIRTDDANRRGGSLKEQTKAKESLEQRYADIRIDLIRKGAEHDRWIEVTRANGERARMWIGRGLDFIRSDGTVESTFIVVEDPVGS